MHVRRGLLLYLNADTEILEGRFRDLLDWMRDHPAVACSAYVTRPTRRLYPTMRRDPSVRRTLAEALLSERGVTVASACSISPSTSA